MSRNVLTVVDALAERARVLGDQPALRAKRDGEWRATTWSEYHEAALRAARAFLALGLEPGRGVNVLGFNRPEWFISSLGAVAAGGLPAGIYTTLTEKQCHYIAEHSEAAVVVVENESQLARILAVRDRLPALEAIVLMEGSSDREGVFSWAELMALGDEAWQPELDRRIAALDPWGLCSLIYTSGTTGPPKAVMLSHHNVLWTAQAVIDYFDFSPDDDFISYLPLSHIAEQMLSLYAPLLIGGCVWFAESLDRLATNLREIRPHILFGVPRVWEKIQAGIEAAAAQNSGLKRRIGAWARQLGLRGGYADQAGRPRPALYGLADLVLFSKVRAKLGLDRARICAVGAAPTPKETLEFFLSLGIPILEVYGLSECTGPATISAPDRYRTGAAGFALEGTEMKIADDGEICIRGPHVFLGYYKNPEATARALDDDGWLHSGDVGEFEADGFLRVTDRKKELIVTSGGKNVAPQPIEGRLKTIPGVAQAVVIGDRRKFLTALITLEPETIRDVLQAADSPASDAEEAVACKIFRAHLERAIESVNQRLARYETIKRFAVLPRPFSIDGGELTPTMKLKRRVIHEKYGSEIERLYAGART